MMQLQAQGFPPPCWLQLKLAMAENVQSCSNSVRCPVVESSQVPPRGPEVDKAPHVPCGLRAHTRRIIQLSNKLMEPMKIACYIMLLHEIRIR